MAAIEMWNLDNSALEDTLDVAKVSILIDLVKEGLLETKDAEEYAATHKPMLIKKGFFRTISDKWRKTKEMDSPAIVMVSKKVQEVSNDKFR